MLHISLSDLRKHTRTQLLALLEQQGETDEVWTGNAGDLLIGDATTLDADEVEEYTMVGTVAEYCEDLRTQTEA